MVWSGSASYEILPLYFEKAQRVVVTETVNCIKYNIVKLEVRKVNKLGKN